MKRTFSLLTLLVVTYLAALPKWAIADPIPEYEMKAAYLYNFAIFTEWPDSVLKNTSANTVRVCILGNDNFGDSLTNLTRARSNGVRIQLSYLADIKNVSNCQILFVDGSELKNAEFILKELENKPILTVSDSEELFRAGLMVGMFLDNKRLAFDVNYIQTNRVKLMISSKLLRMARLVTK